eukprot:gene18175-18421_t
MTLLLFALFVWSHESSQERSSKSAVKQDTSSESASGDLGEQGSLPSIQIPSRPQAHRPEAVPVFPTQTGNGLFQTQFGGVSFSAGFGFFPSLFGLQFQSFIPQPGNNNIGAEEIAEKFELRGSKIHWQETVESSYSPLSQSWHAFSYISNGQLLSTEKMQELEHFHQLPHALSGNEIMGIIFEENSQSHIRQEKAFNSFLCLNELLYCDSLSIFPVPISSSRGKTDRSLTMTFEIPQCRPLGRLLGYSLAKCLRSKPGILSLWLSQLAIAMAALAQRIDEEKAFPLGFLRMISHLVATVLCVSRKESIELSSPSPNPTASGDRVYYVEEGCSISLSVGNCSVHKVDYCDVEALDSPDDFRTDGRSAQLNIHALKSAVVRLQLSTIAHFRDDIEILPVNSVELQELVVLLGEYHRTGDASALLRAQLFRPHDGKNWNREICRRGFGVLLQQLAADWKSTLNEIDSSQSQYFNH